MTRNDATRWGWPAKTLHWIGAALILFLLVHGWWMTHLAPRPERIANYTLHASIGYDFLALLILRLLWRWINPVPALPAELRPWEKIAAQAGHVGLYVLMFAATLTGWALAGTFRTPMDSALFGLVRVPFLVGAGNRVLHDLFEQSHLILSYLLAALVLVHIVGAARHYFFKRNNVMQRMLLD
jgi:cytochrome b561